MCHKTDGSSTKVLPKEQQKMVFVKRGVVVHSGSRCCHHHLYNNHLTYDALQQITPAKIDILSLDADSILELVTHCCMTIQNVNSFDFDDPTSLDEKSYYNMTGLQRGINPLKHILFSFFIQIQINLIIC